MKRRITSAILAFSIAMLAGCNPAGEGLVRKNGSAVRVGDKESFAKPIGVVQNQLLDESTRAFIRDYGSTIKAYATAYGVDWRLILAVMECESGFNSDAESHRGATGLMQLMPETRVEIDQALDINATTDPEDNIHGGVYYLRKLYDMFESAGPADRLRLTLAAYNAGIGRIYDAQLVGAYLHEDPTSWETVRDALPLLSKRYYTLHQNIWEEGKPRAGWFGSARETVAYVEKTMEYYDEYRLVLN